MSIKLGILGATGKVGIELIKLLEKCTDLPLEMPPKLFGTSRSVGKKIKFKDKELIVEESIEQNFEGLNLLISCANGEVSEKLIPLALKKGVKLVIDTDSYYRMDSNIPLITSGVNDEDINWHTGIIAGPNCSTAQLIIPLKVLHEAFGIKRVVVSTYQSVSGAGKAAMDSLFEEVKEITSKQNANESLKPLKKDQFAFNVIPKISKFMENGYTKEEWKVIAETRKMLHEPELAITCTAVRVPVLVGHSESINVELLSPASLEQVIGVLKAHKNLEVWTDKETYPTPIEVAGTEPVHIGRIRKDESLNNAFDMWVVADNLLIGAALNALRIAISAYKKNKI